MAVGAKGVGSSVGAKFRARIGAKRTGGIGGAVGKAATNSASANAYANKSGMGVMANGPAAKTVQPGAGMGIKAKSNTIVDAYKTGGTKAAGKAMREYVGRKKPTDMY